MAQNTQSVTASRATVPGTANDEPVGPPLFTTPPRRDYIPDAKRVGDGLQAPELERARALFAEGDFHRARAEARRVLKSKDATPEAKMEAADLIDRVEKRLLTHHGVSPRGTARLRRLLADWSGPLRRHGSGSLSAELRAVLTAL